LSSRPKNILVIGGSYFIGRTFVECMAKSCTDKIFLVNRGNCPLQMEGITEIRADRHNEKEIGSVLQKHSWDGIIDFCGYGPEDINRLVPFFPRSKIAQYIFISSAAVYKLNQELPVKENGAKLSGPQPHLGPASDYGFHKYLSESALISGCRNSGIPYTILRPTIVYGPYNYAPREQYFFDQILNGQSIAIPEPDLPLFQFVYVNDIARITAACLGNKDTYSKEYNLSAPELISYGRLVDLLSRIIGRIAKKNPMTVEQINQKRIPLPFPLDCHFIFDGSRISRDLQFEYTGLLKGMQQTFEWYHGCKKSIQHRSNSIDE
jgi:2'-hydroxyisoflavone reductase